MIRFAIVLAALIGAAFLMPVHAAGGVSVVYFFPRDVSPTLTVSEADTLMEGVQGWYEKRVGQTFTLQRAQLVRGRNDTAYYQENTWSRILIELGYYCGTGVHVIIVPTSINYAAGGACDPHYSSGKQGGTAMVIEGHFAGATAHEIGHAFTLPHPNCSIDDCSATVMWSWWRYPNVGLLDTRTAPEITTLQESVWFGGLAPTVTPTPEPTPKPCEKRFNKHGKAIGAKRCRSA